MAKKKAVKRRKKVAPKTVGLSPFDTQTVKDAGAERLASEVEADGGAVLARYREPFGGTPVLLAALPIDRVEPTPYQREKLKARGLTSSYLRPFVVARINPIRFSTATEFDFDDVIERMRKAAAKFKIDKIRQEDVVRAGGGPADEDS